jgi:hypothetical protein
MELSPKQVAVPSPFAKTTALTHEFLSLVESVAGQGGAA